MKLKDSIMMSLNDLKNRKVRTFLTCFSIGIGTMLVIVMGGLGQGMQNWVMSEINSMGDLKMVLVSPVDVKKNNSTDNAKKIDADTIDKIKSLSGVNAIRVELDTRITGTKIGDTEGKKVNVVGVDENNAVILNSEIDAIKGDKKNKDKVVEPVVAGRLLQKGDTNSVLVGEKYLNKIGIKDYKDIVGKEIELKVEIPDAEPFVLKARIEGVLNALYSESRMIIVPLSMAEKIQDYYTGEKDYIGKYGPSRVNVMAKTIDDTNNIVKEIEKLGYKALANANKIDYIQKQMNVFNALAMIAGVIVLLVSSIGVINTMTMAVYEKTKSIGIMKAVGASRRNIKTVFLAQSGTLGFIGGVSGVVLALAASKVINTIMIRVLKKMGAGGMDTLFVTPVWLILASVGLAVVISTIAGIIPSGRAAKLDPVMTLSCE